METAEGGQDKHRERVKTKRERERKRMKERKNLKERKEGRKEEKRDSGHGHGLGELKHVDVGVRPGAAL